MLKNTRCNPTKLQPIRQVLCEVRHSPCEFECSFFINSLLSVSHSHSGDLCPYFWYVVWYNSNTPSIRLQLAASDRNSALNYLRKKMELIHLANWQFRSTRLQLRLASATRVSFVQYPPRTGKKPSRAPGLHVLSVSKTETQIDCCGWPSWLPPWVPGHSREYSVPGLRLLHSSQQSPKWSGNQAASLESSSLLLPGIIKSAVRIRISPIFAPEEKIYPGTR